MTPYPAWKYALVALVLILGIIYFLPNMYGDQPAVQVSRQDMSGQTTIGVDSATVSEVEQILQDNYIAFNSVSIDGDTVLAIFADVETQLQAQQAIKKNLGSDYTVALNLAATTPKWLASIGAKPMKLGLDLRGGVHFLLAIDMDSLIQHRINGDVNNLRQELRSADIRYSSVELQGEDTIVISLRNKTDMDNTARLLIKEFTDLTATRSDDNGGYKVLAQMTPAALQQAQDNAVEQSMTILRARINELGVAEPVVQRQGATRIAVDLPGVQDTARAKQILGGTATVQMHLVDVENDAMAALINSKAPRGTTLYEYENQPYLVKNRVILSGSSITGANATIGEDGRPAVSLRLGGGGESMFYRITGENIDKPMGVLYIETKMKAQESDGQMTYVPEKVERLIMVANIKSALGKNFQITGLNSSQGARDLALLLRSGSLPAPISIIEESTVGPSLGKENINKGVISIVMGFIFIVIFMLAYYRLFGFVANIALFMNLVILVAILSVLGATLTLPGMAGIVLTVGMAVDANVLIFERIREELRNGMSPLASIEAGYEKAFATIVDSNVTTLIAAIALYALGTGAIKGFAVTLCIGLLVSMFTAITGSRAIIHYVYNRPNVKRLSIGINMDDVHGNTAQQKG